MRLNFVRDFVFTGCYKNSFFSCEIPLCNCFQQKKKMTATVEILYNKCFGGFGFSSEAMNEYFNRKQTVDPSSFSEYEIERHDPVMLQIVKEMGSRANGYCARLAIQSIPSHFVKYYEIDEYDGSESVQIKYDAYRIDAAKALLRDTNLSKAEKIWRAAAVLSANLDE